MNSPSQTSSKILVVEDNEIHADLVFRHLRKIKRESSDYFSDMQHASCLQDALNELQTESFVAVLLDLSLPDSPIHETLERVTSSFPSLPVIALTSLNDLDFATQAVQDGAQDYLVKTDLSPHVLQRSIRYSIERKRSQRQLEEYANRLEETNQHLENFARTLAHEIRSPLNVISGSLQMLKMNHATALPDETKGMVDDSLLAMKGIAELVEELLEFSQVNPSSRDHGPVELERVFNHVYTVLLPLIKDSNAVISHDTLPVVTGNEMQLRQLFQNLLVNAIKYKSDQLPVVHVSTHETETHWQVSIQDNGVGVVEENRQRIFEAFTRLESTSHLSGVGIGLAFCKRIMDNHDGTIWVEGRNDCESGSVFSFTLPKI